MPIVDMILSSIRKSTMQQYSSYIMKFVNHTNIPLADCSHVELLSFLHELYERGLGYSALNTARSAISTVLDILTGKPVGQHKLVCRYLRGVFQHRPTFPKYARTWDPDIVLNYLDKPSDNLTPLELSRKAVMLVALCSGQRIATVSGILVKDVIFDNDSLTLNISSIIKQSKPGRHQIPLLFKRFTNANLCVLTTIQLYLDLTQKCRGTIDKLWLTTTSPVKAASKNTVANWVKDILNKSGLGEFTPHSVRSAGTTKAAQFLPIDTILAAGGWSQESTFRKFYQKPVKKYEGIDKVILHKHS